MLHSGTNHSILKTKCDLALTTQTIVCGYEGILKELYMILKKMSHISQNIKKSKKNEIVENLEIFIIIENIKNPTKYRKSLQCSRLFEISWIIINLENN